MVELAASLVQLALDSSKDRFKGNIAIIVIEEHQLFDNASKCLLRILMQETYQIRLIFIFTSTEPKSTMVPYGFPFKHQVQLEPFSRQDTEYIMKLACGGNEHKNKVDLVHTIASGDPHWTVDLCKRIARMGGESISTDDGIPKLVLEKYDMLTTDLQQEILQQCAVMAKVDNGTCSLGLLVRIAAEPEVTAQLISPNFFKDEEMSYFLRGSRHHVDIERSKTEVDSTTNGDLDSDDHEHFFKFNHKLIVEAIYESIPRTERLLMHEQVATAIILESLSSFEVEMKHELETIARHYELAQCHEQHNRYLALAISETLTHNTVADLESLILPWLDRIDCHQNPVEGYVTVIRALEAGVDKIYSKRDDDRRRIQRASSFRSVNREERKMQVAESELEKIMTLIKEVEQRKERAVPSFVGQEITRIGLSSGEIQLNDDEDHSSGSPMKLKQGCCLIM